MELSPQRVVHECRIGRERAPLLVIDDFVTEPEAIARAAQGLTFRPVPRAFPGMRAAAGPEYQRLLTEDLRELIIGYFALEARALKLSLCHYSLVTTHPAELSPIQRVPHVDSVRSDGVATIHYLFHADLGGTAFYRHRATGFEFVDESREQEFVTALKAEFEGPDCPDASYINGDTALFERIDVWPAAFNRMLVYKRNSLHSGSIAPDFVPDPNPATGRLSINSFIDAVA